MVAHFLIDQCLGNLVNMSYLLGLFFEILRGYLVLVSRHEFDNNLGNLFNRAVHQLLYAASLQLTILSAQPYHI